MTAIILKVLAFALLVASIIVASMTVTFPIVQDERSLGDATADFEAQVATAHDEHPDKQVGLDFFIIGFPKCGTSTLMSTFDINDETSILHMKDGTPEYSLHNANDQMMEQLFAELKGMDVSDQVKRGIKWPSGIHDVSAIKLLLKHNPPNKKTNLIVGLRHPVRWFESFYNFRRIQAEETDSLPAESLTGSAAPWRAVHTDNARFEEYIVQLGNFDLTKNDLVSLAQNIRTKQIIRTPYEVFFYDVEQLTDTDSERFSSFKNDMTSFLGLDSTLHFNNENHVGGLDFNGKIDICADQFSNIREVLTSNGAISANWIKTNLANGVNIKWGGGGHFFDLVDDWGSDPCELLSD